MILLTRGAATKNRWRPRFFRSLGRVDMCMTPTANHTLPDVVRDLLAGPHLSVLATINPNGEPQTSVIFVTSEGDDILFSTIKGRRKTANMQRDPRVNLLVHRLAGVTLLRPTPPSRPRPRSSTTPTDRSTRSCTTFTWVAPPLHPSPVPSVSSYGCGLTGSMFRPSSWRLPERDGPVRTWSGGHLSPVGELLAGPGNHMRNNR